MTGKPAVAPPSGIEPKCFACVAFASGCREKLMDLGDDHQEIDAAENKKGRQVGGSPVEDDSSLACLSRYRFPRTSFERAAIYSRIEIAQGSFFESITSPHRASQITCDRKRSVAR